MINRSNAKKIVFPIILLYLFSITAQVLYTGRSELHKLTVVQLHKKLNDHNVVYDISHKKANLIDLCIKYDLHSRQITDEQVATEDNTLASLTKTVSELQKTVLSLSGDLNRLIQNNHGNKEVSTSVERIETVNNSDSASFSPVLAGHNLPRTSVQKTSGLSKFGYSAESLPFIDS